MNSEMLEKMKYLYECGFVPDYMVYSSPNDPKYGTLIPLGRYGNLHSKNDIELAARHFSGYFTESRLWSLLPYSINEGEDEVGHLEISKFINLDTNIGFYFTGDKSYYRGHSNGTGAIQKKDLHTALLDLVIWAVENGYLRSDNKGRKQ